MAESWWRKRSRFFRGWVVGSVLWFFSWVVAFNARIVHANDEKAAFIMFFPIGLTGAAWFAYNKFVK